ncbi:MAG: hypothetical protein ABSF99_10235, partial [Anaerolineales bacterium]
CVEFDPGIQGFTPCKSVLDVTEIFNAREGKRKEPAWYMELRPLQYFSNTPGGYIPSAALYTAAYSQLATNGFIGVLNASVNNVQALADAVDAFSDVQYRADAPSVQIPGKDFAWSLADGLLYVWTGGAWHTLGTGDITGAGVVGQVAEFVTNTKTLQAANLIAPTNHILTLQATATATLQAAITAGKTLTLTATDTYNLNIPASGTAALLGSANVFTTQQMVDGTSDQIQVRVQGHSTQTARLQTWEDSAGAVLSSVSGQGYFGIGVAPVTDVLLKTSKTDVSTSGYPYTIQLYGIHNPPTDSSTKIYTLFTNMIGQGAAHLTTIGTFLNQTFNDNTNLTDYAFALNNQVANRSTGTLSYAYGQSLQITNTGGGIISYAYAEIISVSASTGTISNARGMAVTVPSISGTGSIGTAYAIRIDSPSIAGTGSIGYIYAFYIASVSGATTSNYAIYTNAGLIRAGDQVSIDGSANRQQFIVTGYTTQTVTTSIAQITRNDTAAGISVILGLTARGSGAAGDGGSVLLSGKSSTTAAQVMGSLKWAWNVATHASAAADVSLEAGYNNGSAIVGKEFLRGRGAASPLVGVACTLAAGGVTYRTLNVHGSQLWLGQDSSSESPIFEILPAYISNSHSFYTTRTVFNAYDAEGTYECIRFDAVAEARIGFFGAVAVAQQVGCAVPTDLATAITAIKALRIALNAYGFTTVV